MTHLNKSEATQRKKKSKFEACQHKTRDANHRAATDQEGNQIHIIQQAATEQQRISNFIYPTDTPDLSVLPERFIEFCQHSIEGVKGNLLYAEDAIKPNPTDLDYESDSTDALDVSCLKDEDIIEIQPTPSNRSVVAIDTSTIKLGEIAEGSLCALRGTVVMLEKNHYKYVRYGPLVFSLGNNNFENLRDFAQLGSHDFSGESNVDRLLKRIRNILERWMQYNLARSADRAIILIDGSLTAGMPETPTKELNKILQAARRTQSIVIAISKNTKLRHSNSSITTLLEKRVNPSLLNLDEKITAQFPAYPMCFLGRVFISKLARSGYSFRTDVDREVSIESAVQAFRELIGTDIVYQGYPETLRIAHIISTFTASDVLAMQAFAAARFGIQLIPKFALRRSLFGPFGTRTEDWH